eukprot:10160330-Alexandrium_andersonii.AAC.1
MISSSQAGASRSKALLWSINSATRPCGPSIGVRCQASLMEPSSPARSRCRRAAGACSAGSSAADPSKWAITAE